jgi:hypothetical protein
MGMEESDTAPTDDSFGANRTGQSNSRTRLCSQLPPRPIARAGLFTLELRRILRICTSKRKLYSHFSPVSRIFSCRNPSSSGLCRTCAVGRGRSKGINTVARKRGGPRSRGTPPYSLKVYLEDRHGLSSIRVEFVSFVPRHRGVIRSNCCRIRTKTAATQQCELAGECEETVLSAQLVGAADTEFWFHRHSEFHA